MPDYERLYFLLFAAVADAVEELEAGENEEALARLIDVQQDAEELYISGSLTEEEQAAFDMVTKRRFVPMTLKKKGWRLKRDS